MQDSRIVDRLSRVCGPGFVSVRQPDRMVYARDMWPRSLIRQREGYLDYLPDVVVWPADTLQVAQVVRVAAEANLPIIPFGAGSGVCAGTLPVCGGVIVDLKRLGRIIRIWPEDCLLEVECGAVGEILERELNRRGWTLGHFPSSMYCSTVGGWIAARGAGQCSSRYGKMEDLVRSVCFVDAEGDIHTSPCYPPGYAPWSVDPLLVGSEGTLGILVSAVLVVRPLCGERWFRGFRFSDVESGLEVMRLMLRRGLRPSVLRLYDAFDTLLATTGPNDKETKNSLIKGLGARIALPFKGLFRFSLPKLLMAPRLLNRAVEFLPGGCLLVVAQEGQPAERELAAQLITSLCRSRGAVDLGEQPGRHWWQHRYSISYKQSPLFAAGGFVDTMEVATTWDGLPGLYRVVRKAVSRLAFVMAHFSHAYREGCSVYFTFAGAAKDDQEAAKLYDRIWEAAQGAVLAQGAVVSHHHGVGMSKQRFLTEQLAEAGLLGQALKSVLDPKGLFNPGKLGQDKPGIEP